MTDKEKLIALFNELGIGFSDDKNAEDNRITLEAKSYPKVVGYSGFVADFEFEQDGSFKEVGIWE